MNVMAYWESTSQGVSKWRIPSQSAGERLDSVPIYRNGDVEVAVGFSDGGWHCRLWVCVLREDTVSGAGRSPQIDVGMGRRYDAYVATII